MYAERCLARVSPKVFGNRVYLHNIIIAHAHTAQPSASHYNTTVILLYYSRRRRRRNQMTIVIVTAAARRQLHPEQ